MRVDIYDFSKKEIKEILLYFREGFTIKEIAEMTNLTYYEVIYILQKTITGFDLKTYYPYADITDEQILIVSDTHIGSVKENFEYIREAYRVGESKGIKTALHGGDLIQSTICNVSKKYRDENRQIEHLLTEYPTNMVNYIVLGNHDYNTLKKDDHFLKEMRSRDDFQIMGFKRAYLTWQGKTISLFHPCKKYRMPIESIETIQNLRGHSHHLSYNKVNTTNIPTLSNDIFLEQGGKPGFLIGELKGDTLTLDSYYFEKDSLHYKPKILTKKIQ